MFKSLRIWLLAARPKTLGATLAPVSMGGALAYFHHQFHVVPFIATLLAGIGIQIATNLINDYVDFLKGADTHERLGPMRVTQAGSVTTSQMKRAIAIVLIVTSIIGAYLVYHAGLPILIIGVTSLVFAFLYTAGPFSLAYLGLGEIFVLLFFGPVALAGTYFVQTKQWSTDAAILGLAPGLLSTALLIINNLRDVEEDARANKLTLVVRLGPTFVRPLFATCLLGAAVVPSWLVFMEVLPLGVTLVSAVTLLVAIKLIMTLFNIQHPRELNGLLAQLGIFLFVYGFVFAIGLLL